MYGYELIQLIVDIINEEFTYCDNDSIDLKGD